jgi:hypothetical protein
MLKCKTAHEWVEAAIACGADPKLTKQPDGRWWLQTSIVDIDEEQAPWPLPDDLKDGVRELLQDMGRAQVLS